MNGTVTISLEDFDRLRYEHEKVNDAKEKTIRAAKEIEVFLSFLITREDITEYVEEFNNQSSSSQIKIVDGRAKIQLHVVKDIFDLIICSVIL